MTRKTSRQRLVKEKKRKREARQEIAHPFIYHQVDVRWKQDQAKQLRLPSPRGKEVKRDAIFPIHSIPSAVHGITPDGNCFFNALSFIICGSELYQFEIRRAVCKYLLQHNEEIATYLPPICQGDALDYLQRSNMQENRTWASEVEIFTAANMLKTNIYIYTKAGFHWEWVPYAPLHSYTTQSIYLYHRNQNHYDIVLSIGDAPISDQFPSQMQRYFADQLVKEKQLNKNMLERKRYRENSEFREKKKQKVAHKYKTDAKHQAHKKKILREKQKQKYKFDKKYCDQKKKKARERYAYSILYREHKRNMSVLKYSTNPHFRHSVRLYSHLKYILSKAFRDTVKSRSKTKYREDSAFRDNVKNHSRTKYKEDSAFRDTLKNHYKRKYKEDTAFRNTVKNYSKAKYHQDTAFRDKVKNYSARKYRENTAFRDHLKASSVKKYSSSPLFRIKLKSYLKNKYKTSESTRLKKKASVQKRRRSLNKAIQNFRKNVLETPKYVCTVCCRKLFKNQVKICRRSVYMETEVNYFTGNYIHTCEPKQCKTPCENRHAIKEWICHTCHRHLSVGNMPPQAQANGLHLQPIPDVLKRLNALERQLVALRIPFMKLLSLPKGGQKGVKGQVVNVPSDLNSVTRTLPRTVHDAQLVKVKLKRKLSYKGHHQYEWVNPNNVVAAVKYLIENNYLYSGLQCTDTWYNTSVDSDIVREDKPESGDSEDDEEDIAETDKNQLNKSEDQLQNNQKDFKDNTDEIQQSLPVETCFQPLDLGQEFLDTNGRIFCVAPGEGQTPQSIFQEKGAEPMAFPVLLPDGKFGFDAERQVKLSAAKYFNARLFSADSRFAKDNQYIFYAQYMVEMNNIRSNISVALRKGKSTTDDGKKITSSMLTNSDNLQKILKTDAGFRFLQPVRGTPPYWQRTMKDLYAMIRQLGIPTWFVTFSAAETRWSEVITALKEDQRELQEIEWSERCHLISNNSLMCTRLFSNKVRILFSDLILSPSQPIGNVVDYFFRTEFQQRGSPHIHCLVWVEDAPKFGENTDGKITQFVDRYVSCQLPDKNKDPELHQIVSSVQIHSKSHTKSCKKNNSTCRFNFPRPPVLHTFIARKDQEEMSDIPKTEMPTEEEIDQLCKKAAQMSPKDIVKDVWTTINSVDNLEDYTIEDILQAANVTYSAFKDSLEALTTKNTIFHKRDMTDSWVNNYNPHLLKAWNANMDIQFVMDAYSCVAYILSYISKAEAEVGELLSNAKKEARDGNKDAAEAMKHIGQAYIQNREVSAQEAVYRVCGMHLKECSRQVIFIPTGNNALKMSLPISVLKSRNDSDEDNIWMNSIIDKYYARPDSNEFDHLCLAEFSSKYTFFPRSRPPKMSESLPVHELKNDLGFIKKRKPGKEAIIRYPRFNRLKSPEEYYMTLLQLYVPHRQSPTKPSSFHSYEEYVRHGTYNGKHLFNIILEKRHYFEKDSDDLERAWDDVQEGKIGEDAWASVAPEAEAERLEINQMQVDCNDDEINTEANPELILSDTSEKQNRTKGQAIEYQRPAVTTKEIQDNLRSMNLEQQNIFYHIRDWALQVSQNKHPEPFHTFVTGGAGTGKTHLIRCVCHETSRILAKTVEDPEAITVLLTAPTGTAAFSIGGLTIHSAFSISKNITLPYKPLGEDILNTLRTKYSNLQLLIIDEVSMVDHKILTYIHGRLCQIKQCKKPFGNIPVLAVGDFYQLPPVKASPLYKKKDTIVLDLWNPLFSVAFLTQIMRQKEDAKFAELLNRLRLHMRGDSLLEEDMETLKSVSYDRLPDDVQNVLHIFPTNKEVEAHNNSRVAIVCQPFFTSAATDYVRSTVTGQLTQREHPYSTSSSEDLPDNIKIGINARVMLLRNIDVEDGLVNGAFGTVTALEHSKSGNLKAVYVKFDNRLCGKKAMSQTISTVEGSEGAVRIISIEEGLYHKNAVRRQFPLKLGWAATIHKVQGMTAKQIVVSLKNVFQPGMAYVALSRATSLNGLHILNLDTSVIYASDEIKQSVESMPKFLTECNIVRDKRNCVKIVMHNTQGIVPHAEDIKKADVFTYADIVCFTETWLTTNSYVPSTLLPYFKLHTLHREAAYLESFGRDLASMERGGVAIFVSTILSHERYDLHLNNIEYVAVKVNTSKPFVIVTIYRPPVYPITEFVPAIKKLLDTFHDETPVLIIGDFNEDYFNNHGTIKQIFKDNEFHQLVNTPTTEAGTCLDLVFAKGFSEMKLPEVTVQPLYYSFHDPVDISFQI